MAFTQLKNAKYASDLIVDHEEFHFSNDNANVTPGAQPFKLGTVVVRPKGSAPTVAWTAVSADADIVDTNDFAVLYGDHYAFKYDFTPKAITSGKWNAIVVRRGAAFKEYYIKQNYGTVLAADKYALMLELMANCGLLVLTDVSNFTVA